jgi:putative peptidoglycan lipid II flippase
MSVEPEDSSANRQIARAATTVMAAIVISSLVGLLRQVIVANAFGAGNELDAFNSANRVSETLFNLIAGGALSSAFLPTFTSFLARRDQEAAWKLASAIANLIFLIISALCLVAAFFAPELVRYILAPGFARDNQQFTLTVELMRLMLPSAVIFALSGLVMSILNAHQVFLIPALTPAMYQLGLIIGVTLLRPLGIKGLAWGVLIGAMLHLALQIPSLLRLDGHYYKILGLRLASVRQVLFLMVPRLLGVAVVQLNFWVNTNLASRMAEGSVAALTFGFALMLMAQAVIAQSVSTAALPTFSRQAALGKTAEMRSSLSTILRWLLLISLPASSGLVILSIPLVSTLYERGSFTSQDTLMVSWALTWYAVGLVGHSLVEILSRAFYALQDTKTPVMVGIVAMSLNVIFSFSFTILFTTFDWMPFGGLALANSLATGLEAIALFGLMRKRLNGLGTRSALVGLAQGIAGTLVMSLVMIGWLEWTSGEANYFLLLSGFVLGTASYGICLWGLGVPEVRKGFAFIRHSRHSG